MKFYCDNCQTKYSIPDAKVQGKVLKVRCKKCSHIISVRKPEPPAASQKRASSRSGQDEPSPPSKSRQTSAPKWHYSINGQSIGPITEKSLTQKVANGELGDGIYVWKDTFTEWKPIKEVRAFSSALAGAARRRPSPKTLRSSEPIERTESEPAEDRGPRSEQIEGLRSQLSDEADETEQHSNRAASEAKPQTAEASRAGSSLGAGSRKQRLEKLRKRLNLDEEPDEPGSSDLRQSRATASTTADVRSSAANQSQHAGVRSQQAEVSSSTAAEVKSKATGAVKSTPPVKSDSVNSTKKRLDPAHIEDDDELPFSVVQLTDSRDKGNENGSERSEIETFDNEPNGRGVTSGPEMGIGHADTLLDDSRRDTADLADPVASHDGLFSGMDDGQSPQSAAGQTPQSQETSEDEDAVPFFPSAPKLGNDDASDDSASLGRVDEITGSLLIQINEIKSDGRKRAIMASVGALVALVAVGGIAIIGWSQLGSDEEVVDTGNQIRMDHVGAQPQFHEYSEEELARARERLVLDEALVVSREDGRAAYEREERERAQRGEDTDSAPSADDSATAMPSIDPDAFRREIPPEEVEASRATEDESSQPSGSRFARPELPGQQEETGDGLTGEGSPAETGDSEMDSRFEAMAALHSDTERGIHGGDDELLQQGELPEGLSGGDIAAGVQTVMASVGSCRERHIYRGGTIEEEEIEVTLTVMPDGRIGHFEMRPQTLADTDFGRCMQSHTRRWRFPRFAGDPVEVEAPFSLQ